MAEWTGLEPATPGVTGRYSNQLNYHSVEAVVFSLGGELYLSFRILQGSAKKKVRHLPFRSSSLLFEVQKNAHCMTGTFALCYIPAPRHFYQNENVDGCLAQLVERRSYTARVGSSSLSAPTRTLEMEWDALEISQGNHSLLQSTLKTSPIADALGLLLFLKPHVHHHASPTGIPLVRGTASSTDFTSERRFSTLTCLNPSRLSPAKNSHRRTRIFLCPSAAETVPRAMNILQWHNLLHNERGGLFRSPLQSILPTQSQRSICLGTFPSRLRGRSRRRSARPRCRH